MHLLPPHTSCSKEHVFFPITNKMVRGYTPSMLTLPQCLHFFYWTSFTWFYYPNSPLHIWWWSWKDKKEAFKNACRPCILFNRNIFMSVKWIVNQAIHSQDKATPIQNLSVSLKSGLCYHRKQIKNGFLVPFPDISIKFLIPCKSACPAGNDLHPGDRAWKSTECFHNFLPSLNSPSPMSAVPNLSWIITPQTSSLLTLEIFLLLIKYH